MLFLTAIIRLCRPREPRPNDLLAEARGLVGHAALTVIALVYVLMLLWQR